MTGSVFFRMETFGLRARTRQGEPATPWRNISGIIAEAMRLPGGAPHVKGSVAMQVIAGVDPCELEAIAIDQALRAVDRRGRALREDGAALVGCIASYPVASAVLVSDPDAAEAYEQWRQRVVEWVAERWGCLTYAIVEHRDEAHRHLHILIIPRIDDQRHLLIGVIHPGIAARDKHQRVGASTTAQNFAYRAAMRQLLDEFHKAVGFPSGHARIGDEPRRRLSREQALVERRQRENERQLREGERDLIVARDHLQRDQHSLEAKLAVVNEQETRLVAERAGLERQRVQLESQRRGFKAASAAERAQHSAELALKRAEHAEASARIEAETAKNRLEKERLISIVRRAMVSDGVRLAEENARMHAALADAQRKLAALEAEREMMDPSATRRFGAI